MGSTRDAVSKIVCTTEVCIDSISPTRRFLWGGAKFGWHELVDSPDESSLSYLLCAQKLFVQIIGLLGLRL